MTVGDQRMDSAEDGGTANEVNSTAWGGVLKLCEVARSERSASSGISAVVLCCGSDAETAWFAVDVGSAKRRGLKMSTPLTFFISSFWP